MALVSSLTCVLCTVGYIQEVDVLVTENMETVIIAPARLIAENRVAFRADALDAVDRAAAASGSVVVDLAATTEIDSSGLGLLVLIQKRSREKGLKTVLRGTGKEVRSMLVVTKLEMLFTMQD